MSQIGKILVFGAKGYLGSQLVTGLDAIASKTDIRDPQRVAADLAAYGTEVAINAAGITGKPNIDWCQANQENMRLTQEVNAEAVGVLAEQCRKYEVRLVHISSAAVYEATLPTGGGFAEYHVPVMPGEPGRVSWYARTKRMGELAVGFEALVVRIHMPFSHRLHGRNLFTRMAGYPTVVDAVNTITSVDDLVMALRVLIAERAIGTWHVVNPEPINNARIMQLYTELCDPNHRFTVVESGSTSRPGVVLSSKKLSTAGIVLRPTEEALTDSMRRYGKL